jgi:hypothetical protein
LEKGNHRMKKRQIPFQGKGRRFRADLWLDEKITGRTLNALQMRGIKFPDGWNPRKTPEFKQEYQRQLTQFRQQQAAKKVAKKETQQAAQKPAESPAAAPETASPQ